MHSEQLIIAKNNISFSFKCWTTAMALNMTMTHVIKMSDYQWFVRTLPQKGKSNNCSSCYMLAHKWRHATSDVTMTSSCYATALQNTNWAAAKKERNGNNMNSARLQRWHSNKLLTSLQVTKVCWRWKQKTSRTHKADKNCIGDVRDTEKKTCRYRSTTIITQDRKVSSEMKNVKMKM
jgi:hypothetical protein